MMFGIYIHIPFCLQRCPFCDFTLVTGVNQNFVETYVNTLCQEIELVDVSQWPFEQLTSIFFGGGTPSYISEKQIAQIILALQKKFSISYGTEITLETNPEDVDDNRARNWKSIGVNRISLGAQSMIDIELHRLGRNHTRRHIVQAFQVLRKTGFQNISMDLMFGSQHQTLTSWKRNLEEVFTLGPEHISTYNLTIEKNTAFEKELAEGRLRLPSDEIQSSMLITGKDLLERHGYDPYEISNACKKGFESKHNMLYWTGKPYLGLGVSAHSFLPKNGNFKRWWNTKNIPQYSKDIQNKKLPIQEEENLSRETHLQERFLTGLRLKKGLNLTELQNEGFVMNDKIEKQIQILIGESWLTKTSDTLQIPTQHIPLTQEILLRLFS
jgi:oxygen-independent coproporphyrinogen-3 oxidase